MLLFGFLWTVRLPTDFLLTHVDEFIDELLTKDYSYDISLPRILEKVDLYLLV